MSEPNMMALPQLEARLKYIDGKIYEFKKNQKGNMTKQDSDKLMLMVSYWIQTKTDILSVKAKLGQYLPKQAAKPFSPTH